MDFPSEPLEIVYVCAQEYMYFLDEDLEYFQILRRIHDLQNLKTTAVELHFVFMLNFEV